MASLYVDEHVALAVIRALRRAGHDPVRFRDYFPEGTNDDVHFERAIHEERVLLTQDTDFLGLSAKVLSEGKHHPGIVYWPRGVYRLGQVIQRLKQYLEATTPETRRDMVKFL